MRKKKQIIMIAGIVLLLVAIGLLVWNARRSRTTWERKKEERILSQKQVNEWPELQVNLLDINPYSRPGDPLEKVNGIVIHYTANAGASAMQNRDYFNGLAKTGETYASSHFVIGLEGEIVQCIPCSEIAYASNERNADTISIECCNYDETGRFRQETYDSLVELTAWLVGRYDLSIDDIIRHYDVTGKKCPKYFVEHEDAWEEFKYDVLCYIDKNGEQKTVN